MKVVILAGGLGTRIGEESHLKPKPLIEIGDKPILWHIMKIYSAFGFDEFIVCCGYKGYLIKEYFSNYFLHNSNVTFDLINRKMEIHDHACEPWKVTVVDTGQDTLTGGRLKRVREYIGDEDFCFTYGDGVGDVDIAKTVAFHKSRGKLCTITAAQPPGRFGQMKLDGDLVASFQEKPEGGGGHVNGGFFVLSPKAIDYVRDDRVMWEREPMEHLARDRQIAAWVHDGFWQPMDTLRDKNVLDELWRSGKAPWKIW
ncbi:MAG: glucose-1-phosphate cytidylyltransferase [Nitrospinae bacterium]|nr:glucose-1-phosphate cytidylyltransferase [Nitrospinota bacterium]